MSAPLAGKFQDHYQVLGIEPDADAEAIGQAYETLSAMYHPRNPATADKTKFEAVVLAHEVLSDPGTRKVFDSVRSGPEKEAPPVFSGTSFFEQLARERERRQFILCLLYDRRRVKPRTPGFSARQLESLTTMSFAELEFAIWYLKQTGMVASDDKSNLTITVRGMDYLEDQMPEAESMMKLMKVVGVSEPAPRAAMVAPVPQAKPAAPAPESVPAPASKPVAPEAAGRRSIVIPPKQKSHV
ncbi:MAG: hypothetical protein FJW20_18070 [Acidimicrobiia bacterium]|nr:hypothetical protein [Acidimicrobiia bacterium]